MRNEPYIRADGKLCCGEHNTVMTVSVVVATDKKFSCIICPECEKEQFD